MPGSRGWKNGDTVSLELPMQVAVRTWAKNHNAVSVDYGPLTFSLRIGEKWNRYGNNPAWPEWEVLPTTPWNYGLVFNPQTPGQSFQLVQRAGPLPANPFTPDSSPSGFAPTPGEFRVGPWTASGWSGHCRTALSGAMSRTKPSPSSPWAPPGCAFQHSR